MSNQGDDCYFYFYSTCNKGDSCSFRHCEAALGSETVCTLWQEGRCFRNICRFRHMEIDKKRSEIPCYWENQPVGCQKANCAFHHAKGRYVEGLFLPPSKTTLPSPPESAEDDVKMAQISLQQNKLSVQSNPCPQLRGVMKVENSENVPSPTHPPVVINAADDDEDDDDQLSEEGDETKTPVQQPATEAHNGLRIISTRKSNANTNQDVNLNFGIKTLEEIKLKKLKEKTKKQGEGPSGVSVHPLQSLTVPVPEKENERTVVRTVTLSTKQGEEPVIRLNLADRLGKPKPSVAGKSVLPLRRNLAERLGKKIEILENADKAPKRVQVPKSLKERLGLPSEQTSTETEKAAKPAGKIHVKTLEEIRLERANQRRGEPQAKPQTEGCGKTEDPSLGARPPAVRIKAFSGALVEKKRKRMEDEKQKPEELPTKVKVESEPKKQSTLAPPVPSKVQLAESAGKAKPAGEVRIKTLEEIKQEKALRMQQSGENVPAPPAQPEPAPTGRRLLRITKLIGPGREEKKIVELNKLSPKAVSAPAEPSDQSAPNAKVQVKSLEEIMKEKRQLKRCQEEKLQKEAAAVPSPVEKAVKDKTPASGNPESTVVSGPCSQFMKRALVKPPEHGVQSPGKDAAVPPGKQAAQLPERKAKTKPKACLKPSDGKATCPTKQTLKRKAAENHPSAVAAVKPLSTTGGDTQELPAKKAAVAVVPVLPEDSLVSVPGREKPKTSPELHIGSQADFMAQSEVSSSTSTSLQVPVKTRRLSSTGAGKAPLSVEDDFEKLIWEISGGKLEAEIDLDPGKDEDDLLLELSEMIDS
ncbi:zinc finger CCCH domain-containing protein 11A isoform X1 [Falco naumanni]|uniref:zinc finger CCCH domain-containing protein 11A isoform X1 n=1 Tax=Falco naumanni TaxID=148594 RepID=UPI001ADDFFFE|nr:zinc finger CCCH domain-containing protein 11A isoform X1 [Falco naumanni]XP_040472314.1 zinc finger CCCH domain-containing protein 11A isoform X1 [Falco naumanni]XP_040472315.1 zinc finger CCCH domain-containing protein 11A isoform X1 [Falco naumanni]XP_040472316.1 zinc finger CCCH domain-containing protein 11A isoform X1 [Falco naumanni]XP_040472317.1 zinc finger CCCH domain-containing protein 11A isoform X1 [Falco naumanni]XP_040472318.1 zinc finger CCCH domain-containing protein 11A iso